MEKGNTGRLPQLTVNQARRKRTCRSTNRRELGELPDELDIVLGKCKQKGEKTESYLPIGKFAEILGGGIAEDPESGQIKGR
jgi:hypothetical protein